LPANLRATFALFNHRPHKFVVTPKGRGDGSRTRVPAPRLLTGLLTAQFVGLAWYGATALGYTPLHYRVPWTAHGAAFWIVINTTILVLAINRIRAPRFAAERRASVRFNVDRRAFLDGHRVQLDDVSLTGASLLAEGHLAVPGQRIAVGFATTDSFLNLPALVRSAVPEPGTVARFDVDGDADWMRFGVEFDNVPDSTTAELALALFRTGLTPQVVYPELQLLAG
jgi:hypothetical protein